MQLTANPSLQEVRRGNGATVAALKSGSHQSEPAPAQVNGNCNEELEMNGLIYLVGLVVVILAVLSFFGLR
jgi:hypothetical protein